MVWNESTNSDLGSECQIEALIFSAYRGTFELDTIGNRITQVLTTTGTYSGVSGYMHYHFDGYRVLQNVQMVSGQLYRQGSVRIRVWVN
jgi:hypothetical protein